MNPEILNLLDQAENAETIPQLSTAADHAVMACPLRDNHAVEILVIGEDDLPLVDVAVALHDGQGRALRSATRHSGIVRFEGLSPAPYTLAFPQWDHNAWRALTERNTPLMPLDASYAAPTWTPSGEEPGTSTEHTVLHGECMGELAFRYGFALATLRLAAQNLALRKPGRSPYLLLPGESVHIPRRRARFLPAQLDVRHVIRRRGVPELFRVRFMDWKGEPRRGLSCIVQIMSADGRPLPDLVGQLDDTGELKSPIPPDATAVEVRLQAGLLLERYVFQLGEIDPVESNSGLVGRSLALGFGRHHGIARLPDELADLMHSSTDAERDGTPDIALKRHIADVYRS